MSIPKRAISPPGTYFLTTNTLMRQRHFTSPALAQLLVETLQHYRREGHYKLYDFVVMPDHLHLLLSPINLPLERVMMYIKGGFSRRMDHRFPVWQRGFSDHRIRDRSDFDTHRRYIRENPIRARLCTTAEVYPYSSAYRPATLSA
jgi:putative transposase